MSTLSQLYQSRELSYKSSSTVPQLAYNNQRRQMQSARRTELRKRVIGYMNICAIILGITHSRVNFEKQRVDQPHYIHIYVLCANVVTLAFLPFVYVELVAIFYKVYDHNFSILADSVHILITFGAVIVSVVLRWRHEALYMDMAKAIFQLESDYFGKLTIDNPVERRSDYLILFKVLIVFLQTMAPFHATITLFTKLNWRSLLVSVCYSYAFNLVSFTRFVYFYLMWLLRKRFSLLNTKLSELFCSLQELQQRDGNAQCTSSMRQLQQLGALATEELRKISRIQAQLSALTVRLNEDYKMQILVGLLIQLFYGISYGYYVYVLNRGYFDAIIKTPALSNAFIFLILFDGNMFYWVAETTARACQATPQLLRRFQVLPVLEKDFEEQCELFALQLKQHNGKVTVAGMFSLNLQASLAVWAFAFQQIIILVKFDYESHM